MYKKQHSAALSTLLELIKFNLILTTVKVTFCDCPHGTDEELVSERLSDSPPVTWLELAKDRVGIKSQVWLPQRLMLYMPGVNQSLWGRVELFEIPQHSNKGRNRRNRVPMKSHPASLGSCFEDTPVHLIIFSTFIQVCGAPPFL